jgi:predicted O-methyltransferase YrrM
MNFISTGAAAVYARYEARLVQDLQRMQALGPTEGYKVRDSFLLPVGPEVGRLLHALVLAHRPRRILELGTSYGYSTLFLADAARAVGAQVVSMELAAEKQAYARAEIEAAGLADVVDFRLGDAVALLHADPGPWDFVLLDIWKELYVPCFEALYPKLAPEGLIAADNMIEPEMARPDVRTYRAAVRAKGDLQTTLLPVGSGIELSVRWPAGSAKL